MNNMRWFYLFFGMLLIIAAMVSPFPKVWCALEGAIGGYFVSKVMWAGKHSVILDGPAPSSREEGKA